MEYNKEHIIHYLWLGLGQQY